MPDRGRLVLVVLRGGVDGLAALVPVGDPDSGRARGALALGASGLRPLDGTFALAPGLAPLGDLRDDHTHRRMSTRTPLTALLEEAFPADWRASNDTPEGRLRVGLSVFDSSECVQILAEVHELLGRGLCDMQLTDLVAFELGCHLRPDEVGLTASEWLRWVGRHVAEALHGAGEPFTGQ